MNIIKLIIQAPMRWRVRKLLLAKVTKMQAWGRVVVDELRATKKSLENERRGTCLLQRQLQEHKKYISWLLQKEFQFSGPDPLFRRMQDPATAMIRYSLGRSTDAILQEMKCPEVGERKIFGAAIDFDAINLRIRKNEYTRDFIQHVSDAPACHVARVVFEYEGNPDAVNAAQRAIDEQRAPKMQRP